MSWQAGRLTCDECMGSIGGDLPPVTRTRPLGNLGVAEDHYHQTCWRGLTEADPPTCPQCYSYVDIESLLTVVVPHTLSPHTQTYYHSDCYDPWADAPGHGAGEVRTTSSTGGEKGVKPARFDLIPVGPLTTVAKLYGRGAEKYEDHNWRKGYEWSKSYAALMRHVTQFWDGEDEDDDTGLPHLAAVVFHALALMQYMEEHREFDDRPIAKP